MVFSVILDNQSTSRVGWFISDEFYPSVGFNNDTCFSARTSSMMAYLPVIN